MMLYPPVSELIAKAGSPYALVNMIAKRAREISALAERDEIVLDKKAVSEAIDEIYYGTEPLPSENYSDEDIQQTAE